MWTSSQARPAPAGSAGGAELGPVTVSGAEAGVYLNGERRWLPVLAPGGYRWRPGVGQQVLVIKTGADGEAPCVLAAAQSEGDGLAPGEVELVSNGCRLRLTNGGGIELTGTVKINGVELEQLIRAAAILPIQAETAP